MSWPASGIHEAVPFDLYRSDDINQSDTAQTVIGKAVSKSLITSFLPDPSAWKASPPKKQTKAMKGGSLFDCLLTTPDEFESRYIESPYAEFRTNESKAWKAEQEFLGVEVVKADQILSAKAQLAAVLDHPAARALVKGARKQVAFRHSTRFGFDAKGLIDLVPDDEEVLADVKACEPRALESHRSLQRYIFEWDYHIQAGSYCQGWNIASGEERRRFKFIFVTSSAPFRVAVIELPLAAIMFGADRYVAGMKAFAGCLESNRWPSIWDDETELDLPEYAYTEGGL